jgi:hypothetical protein
VKYQNQSRVKIRGSRCPATLGDNDKDSIEFLPEHSQEEQLMRHGSRNRQEERPQSLGCANTSSGRMDSRCHCCYGIWQNDARASFHHSPRKNPNLSLCPLPRARYVQVRSMRSVHGSLPVSFRSKKMTLIRSSSWATRTLSSRYGPYIALLVPC